MSEQARRVENKAVPEWAQGLYYNSGLMKEVLLYQRDDGVQGVFSHFAHPALPSVSPLHRWHKYIAYSTVSSPVSGSTTVWPIVTQPSAHGVCGHKMPHR
jgi:hypothetical protein